jgi:hypothetical protein
MRRLLIAVMVMCWLLLPAAAFAATAPTFTSSATAGFSVATSGSFTIAASGSPVPALSIASGSLPQGLAFAANSDGSATISGTPAMGSGGSYPLIITASSSAGNAMQNLTVTVSAARVMTLKPTGLIANGEPVTVTYNSNSRLSFPTQGTLNGLVNPNNDTCTVSFEYGPTTAYGSSVGYGTVSGAALVPVSSQANFTWIHDYFYNPELHYRTKAVCATSGTWYGNDITFVPFTSTVRWYTDLGGPGPANASFPTVNIQIVPTCSDSATMATFDMKNWNDYDVTVYYSDGGAYSGSVIIGSMQVQQIFVGKGSIASFSYNYTLFEQILTNDRLCSEPQSPSSLVRGYALGLADTKAASGSEIFAIYNDNPAPVTLEVMAVADVFNVTIPARSSQLIATGEAEAQLSYNAAPFQVISPLSIYWADRYLVTAQPVCTTATTNAFMLSNNGAASQTAVLRNGGTEHRYDLAPYESRQVTVESGSWDLYLVVPGMAGPGMVGDHVKVATLGNGAACSRTLTVSKSGAGDGTVAATGCTLVWNGATGSCSAGDGTSITLSGNVGSNGTFLGWSNGIGSTAPCSGTADCTFTLTADSQLSWGIKLAQTIFFAPPANKIYGDAPIDLATFASGGASGNPVTFSVTSGHGSISGSMLTITGAGDLVITASQAGNASYDAAVNVSRTITVAKANAGISLVGLQQPCDGTARTVSATTTPAGKNVSITYNGSPVAPTAAGSYSVVATIVDADYQGSAQGTLVVMIPVVTAFVVDPAAPASVYAGIDGAGVYKSSDSGASWLAATTQPANLRIKALVIKPGGPAKLYAASYGGGIFKSIDSGVTWNACANTALGSLNAVSLAIDPSGKLYAGTGAGIFISSDCSSWSAVNSGLPVNAATPPVAIIIDPAVTSTLYAALDGAGIYKSTDSGASWLDQSQGLVSWWPATSGAADAANSNNATLGGTAAITASGYSGNGFSFDGSGYITIADNPSLHLPQFSASLWFNWDRQGAADVEFLMAKGQEHYEIQLGGSVNNIRFIPYNGIYVDAPNAVQPGWNHLLVSYSGSQAKMYVNGVLTTTAAVAGGDPSADAAPLYLGQRGDGTLRFHGTMDEAALFNRVQSDAEAVAIYNAGAAGVAALAAGQPGNRQVKALAIKPGDSTKLFAATYEGGLFRSTDSGVTWSACATQPGNLNLLSLTIAANGTLYAGSEAGVFVSGDGCGTWTAKNAGLP